jgi:hypothetical protein
LAKRNKQLGSQRTRTACRLHALLVELVPGGISKEITVNRAARRLESITPSTAVELTRYELAHEPEHAPPLVVTARHVGWSRQPRLGRRRDRRSVSVFGGDVFEAGADQVHDTALHPRIAVHRLDRVR